MYSYFNHFSSIHIEILQCIRAIYSTEEHHKTLKRIVTQDIKMDFYPIFCPQKSKIVLCVHVKVESDLDTNDNNPKTHKIHSHLSLLRRGPEGGGYILSTRSWWNLAAGALSLCVHGRSSCHHEPCDHWTAALGHTQHQYSSPILTFMYIHNIKRKKTAWKDWGCKCWLIRLNVSYLDFTYLYLSFFVFACIWLQNLNHLKPLKKE